MSRLLMILFLFIIYIYLACFGSLLNSCFEPYFCYLVILELIIIPILNPIIFSELIPHNCSCFSIMTIQTLLHIFANAKVPPLLSILIFPPLSYVSLILMICY